MPEKVEENEGRRVLRGSVGRKRAHPHAIRFSNRPFYPVFTSSPAAVNRFAKYTNLFSRCHAKLAKKTGKGVKPFPVIDPSDVSP